MSDARKLIEAVAQGADPQTLLTEGLIEGNPDLDRLWKAFSSGETPYDDAAEVALKIHQSHPNIPLNLTNGLRQAALGKKSKADILQAISRLMGKMQEHGWIGFESRDFRVAPAVPSGMREMQRHLGESYGQLEPKDYPGLQKSNLAKLEAAHKALMDAYQGARRLLADLDHYAKSGGGDTFGQGETYTKFGREVIENSGKAADAIVKVVHVLRAMELG